jgi:DNA mismatch repair ATPase MutS
MLIEELEDAEEQLKNAISPFVCALFQRFYENRNLWQPAIQVISELDCLTSLAVAST